jgi:hypothetical protein
MARCCYHPSPSMLAAPPVPLADSDDDDDNDERRMLHQEILEWMERKDSDKVRFAHSDGKIHPWADGPVQSGKEQWKDVHPVHRGKVIPDCGCALIFCLSTLVFSLCLFVGLALAMWFFLEDAGRVWYQLMVGVSD